MERTSRLRRTESGSFREVVDWIWNQREIASFRKCRCGGRGRKTRCERKCYRECEYSDSTSAGTHAMQRQFCDRHSSEWKCELWYRQRNAAIGDHGACGNSKLWTLL